MFALIDCNNFFASCEIVFNPKLENQPLVVLSNNDGCIIARSKKAKEIGIQMGDPAYLYNHRKDIVMLSANFPLYSDMSQRVMQTLSTFSYPMEIYSIDEAFLEIDEDESLEKIAIAIRQKISQWVGLPVSVGIAPTKTLAKLAGEIGKKKNGVFVMNKSLVDEVLAKTEVADIWGIGRNLTQKLKRKGIYSAKQLADAEETWIRSMLGVNGEKILLELRSVPCFHLNETPEKKKSIVCSRSFGQKVTALPLLEEAVASFAAHAAEKLREQGSLANFISIFASTNQETGSISMQLPNPTAYTPELITLAKRGASQIYRPNHEYRKAGVLLGDFTDGTQIDFLTKPKKNKTEAMKILDEINAKYDKPILRFAAEGIERPWKSRRSNTSPKFTTSWADLLKVR